MGQTIPARRPSNWRPAEESRMIMFPTNVTAVHNVLDDDGLPRALVYIRSGQEWVSKQLAARVLVAVSYALGEKSQDWSAGGWERANAEIARRLARRPPGFKAEIV